MRNLAPAFFALAVSLAAGVALAQTTGSEANTGAIISNASDPFASLVYPIPELGACTSKDACKKYCDDSSHARACIAFAQGHGLMSASDAALALRTIDTPGPGGCIGPACRTYCTDPTHTNECLVSAEKIGFITGVQMRAALIVLTVGGPHACKSIEACRTYCSLSANRYECVQFAAANGLAPRFATSSAQIIPRGPSPELLRTINTLLATTTGPGGCTNVGDCRSYCADPANSIGCVQFARDNGLMTVDDAARAISVLSNPGPGGCLGEACKTYCDDMRHINECLSFANARGIMSVEDALATEAIIQSGGPGGCPTIDTCKAFCAVPANIDVCTAFMQQNGMEQRDNAGLLPPLVGPSFRHPTTSLPYYIKPMQATTTMPDFIQQPAPAATPLPVDFDTSKFQGLCTTLAECQAFCTANPITCQKLLGFGAPPATSATSAPALPFPIPMPSESMLPLSPFTAAVFSLFESLLR